MKKFKEFIKGKRVCFVGASPIMKGRGLGQCIDSFDVVVRTNGSIDLIESKEFQKDYGRKIDVLYTNNQFYREMRPLPLDKYKEKGVKWLCMKTCSPHDHEKHNKKIGCRVITNTLYEVTKDLPSATMGAFIYKDILKCDPDVFWLYGVDFFSSKKSKFEHDNYQEYFPGYLPDKIRIQGNEINKNKKEDGHNFKENAQFIYDLYRSNDNFVMPDFIENILEGIVKGEVKQK